MPHRIHDARTALSARLGTECRKRRTHHPHSAAVLRQSALRTGLPDKRWRDLRHTCATLLLGRGVHPKLVQHLLGHASITITLDLYSHWIPSMGRHAADGMDEALG